MLQGAVLL